MATNKQIRAQQKRRYEQFQAKIAAREAKRRRRNRYIAIVVVAALLLAGGAFTLHKLTSSTTPTVTMSPTSTATPAPTATNSALAPPPSVSEYRTWTATFDTNMGSITATLDGAKAPQAVATFVTLAKEGFFKGNTCHRLVDQGIFVLQCGSSNGTSSGGPGFTFGPIENAPADNVYPAGTLAMARVPNDAYSMGSQFFFVYADSPIPADSVGGYTVFGQITDGLTILEGIGKSGTSDGTSDGPPAKPVVINEVTVQ